MLSGFPFCILFALILEKRTFFWWSIHISFQSIDLACRVFRNTASSCSSENESRGSWTGVKEEEVISESTAAPALAEEDGELVW